jgi:hypothetical protein
MLGVRSVGLGTEEYALGVPELMSLSRVAVCFPVIGRKQLDVWLLLWPDTSGKEGR